MSYKKEGSKLDLKLNLSPPPRATSESPLRSSSSVSPPSSCVSREPSPADDVADEANSMMLVGCPRCLMYIMLAQEDPKCPKCKSTVLLDFFHEESRVNNSKK